MNKKVLVLSASPRRGGNSELLCDEFIKGVEQSGSQAEKIFLKDKKINYCTGCGQCFDRGKGCSQKDDMDEVLQKMVEADVIVMATPVYFYSMNGQMKTLVDRTCARNKELNNKDFYYILTAGDANQKNLQRAVEGFRGLTSCLENPKEKGIVYGTGFFKKGEIAGSAVMHQAYEMGKTV